MKNIKIEDKEISMKNDWSELTFSEFNELDSILKSDVNPTLMNLGILTVLTKMEMKDIHDLPAAVTTSLMNELAFLQKAPEPINHKDKYEVNGHVYITTADLTEISTAQYVDYQNYLKEEEVDVSKVVSVFLVPEGHKYNDGYKLKEVWRDINDMPFQDVNAISFFLRRQLAAFILILEDSLQKNLKEMTNRKNSQPSEQVKILLHNMALSLLSSNSAR